MERFPALADTMPVALFEAPTRAPDESDESFAARQQAWQRRRDARVLVKVMPKPVFRELSFLFQDVVAEERRRLRDLRAASDAELRPELALPTYRTREGHRAMDELVLRVFQEGVAGIEGQRFGDVDVATEKDPVKLFELMRHAGYHELVMLRALGAQSLEPAALLL